MLHCHGLRPAWAKEIHILLQWNRGASIRLPSDSSTASRAWLEAMSQPGSMASLRVPSTHSIWGGAGQFASLGKASGGGTASGDDTCEQQPGAEGDVGWHPRRRSLEGGRASLSDPDFVASLPAAPELAAGVLRRGSHRCRHVIHHTPRVGSAVLLRSAHSTARNLLHVTALFTALATARRDGTDAAQHEGCVQLRDLQLYRRPGGEPWLLGRGSNGMVCAAMAACVTCQPRLGAPALVVALLTGMVMLCRCSRPGAVARMSPARCSRWTQQGQAMRCASVIHLTQWCAAAFCESHPLHSWQLLPFGWQAALSFAQSLLGDCTDWTHVCNLHTGELPQGDQAAAVVQPRQHRGLPSSMHGCAWSSYARHGIDAKGRPAVRAALRRRGRPTVVPHVRDCFLLSRPCFCLPVQSLSVCHWLVYTNALAAIVPAGSRLAGWLARLASSS